MGFFFECYITEYINTKSNTIMKTKKVVHPFRISIEQKNMLEKLGLKKSQFIRDAITEKFEREPDVFKEKK